MALLDVFRERVHHLPLLRAGETLPFRNTFMLRMSLNVSSCESDRLN